MSVFLEFRVVGGLLSAYDLSNDQVFLDKAKDIADRLLPAWDTPSGIPYNIINLAHGRPHNPGWTGVSCYFSSCRPYHELVSDPGQVYLPTSQTEVTCEARQLPLDLIVIASFREYFF